MKTTIGKRGILHLVAAIALLVCALGPARGSVHAASSRYFSETGKTVSDPFLSYWTGHSGRGRRARSTSSSRCEKRGEMDQGIGLLAYYSLVRVARASCSAR